MKKMYFIVVLLISQIALAQVANEATPRGWDLAFKSQPQKVVLPSIDLEALETEDNSNSQILTKPFKFGKKNPCTS